MTLTKTRIEWLRNPVTGELGFSINPVRGRCPNPDCPLGEGCYARRLYKRFKWNPEIRFEPMVNLPKKPSRIFVGSTMELFGEWIDAFWLDSIFRTVRDNPQHTFIFLTKCPQNLAKWNPYPQNCYIGVSVCNDVMLDVAVEKLEDIQAKTKFLSIEPLMGKITLSSDYAFYYSGINWLILGCQTPMSEKTLPKREWVDEIISAADKAGIPAFVKEPMASHFGINRKEFPTGLRG